MDTKIKSVLEIGKDLLPEKQRGGHRVSIYKPEILSDDLSKSERNSIRKQLRRKLESFMEASQTLRSDEGKMKELKRAWKQYATAVYVNPKQIIESNAGEEKQNLVAQFLTAMGEPKKIIVPGK